MVNNKMKANIEKDAFGVPYVVDEDSKGTKAIPLVFVTKGSDGEFSYGGDPAGKPTNKMKRPLEEDSEGVVKVVDEDINGVKAIPFVVVTKDETGAFVYGEVLGGGGSASAWLNGTTVPAAATGKDGDYYLHITATVADVYAKAAGAWAKVGSIKGAKGDKGDTGATGPAGFGTQAQYNDIIARLTALETPQA